MHLVGTHAKHVLHELVGFADKLHIAVLYPVVDHLYEMPCTVASNPVAARGSILHLGADGLEDWLDQRPCGRRAARHHGRTLEGALFATGDSGPNIQEPLALDICGSANRIWEVAVSTVYDDITWLKNAKELLNVVVYRSTCLYEHHDLSRLCKRVCKFLEAMGSNYV